MEADSGNMLAVDGVASLIVSMHCVSWECSIVLMGRAECVVE